MSRRSSRRDRLVGGKADYLVTNDLDLLVLRDDSRVHPLRIVTAAEFLQVL